MVDLRFTGHAEVRMRQRGFRKSDIGLLLNVATRISDDAFFLRDKDVAREVELRRSEIQDLERMRGTRLVVVGKTVVTVHHAERKRSRKCGGRRRGM